MADDVHAYALDALPFADHARVGAHVAVCAECRAWLAAIRPVVKQFGAWPIDTLRPSRSLWTRLAGRLGIDPGLMERPWREPEWREVSPGISCKLLSRDAGTDLVSMMVRLAPGVAYPAHKHAGFEQLHLLDGELWIGDRKLYAGDYNAAQAGSTDVLVWSETGCTCVLITSERDLLTS
jgi:anti-sigma factor ChrR (cupin superfamily)